MAILYDRNGNEVFIPDGEVDDALKQTLFVHNQNEPQFYLESPDKRTPEEKAVAGAVRARKRASMRVARDIAKAIQAAHAEILARSGDMTILELQTARDDVAALLQGEATVRFEAEIAVVKAQLLASAEPKLKLLGGAL